jgi:two-component system, NarL family, nitrate/nitrite response regulator NarL
MRKKRVLIVDDNVAVRSMVRQVFSVEPDFEVSGEAENGLEAIQTAEALKPDLVILDLTMPIMTGLDAAPQLLARLPAVCIILFTVEESTELKRLAQAQGIHAVVSKQQAVSELVSQARSLLGLLNREGDSDQFRNAS